MLIRYLPLLPFLVAHGLHAQNCLSLSTAAVAPGGSASLELSLRLTSETSPASLQWSFQYPSSGLSSLTVDNGPAATAAGKTIICNGNPGLYTCLAVGANAKTMANGVVARITAVLAPNIVTTLIRITDPLGSSAAGYFVPMSSDNGFITSANVSPDGRLHPPLRRISGGWCQPM